jgi:hypothetical protein
VHVYGTPLPLVLLLTATPLLLLLLAVTPLLLLLLAVSPLLPLLLAVTPLLPLLAPRHMCMHWLLLSLLQQTAN